MCEGLFVCIICGKFEKDEGVEGGRVLGGWGGFWIKRRSYGELGEI